jgi:DNA-binding transcriptional regulator YiaG
MSWARTFKAHRVELGYEPADVAVILDVPVGTIKAWEAGNAFPKRGRWGLVGLFLGWSEAEFIKYALNREGKSTKEDIESERRRQRVKVDLERARKEEEREKARIRFIRMKHQFKKKG